MKKRLFSILLVLALLCSLLPQAAFSARAEGAPVFEDVPEDAYYKDAVDWAIENGITSGTSPTTFSPKKNLHPRGDHDLPLGRGRASDRRGRKPL